MNAESITEGKRWSPKGAGSLELCGEKKVDTLAPLSRWVDAELQCPNHGPAPQGAQSITKVWRLFSPSSWPGAILQSQEPTRDFPQRADLSVTLRFNVSSLKVASNLWSDTAWISCNPTLLYPVILAWVTKWWFSNSIIPGHSAGCRGHLPQSQGTQHCGDCSLHRGHWSWAQPCSRSSDRKTRSAGLSYLGRRPKSRSRLWSTQLTASLLVVPLPLSSPGCSLLSVSFRPGSTRWSPVHLFQRGKGRLLEESTYSCCQEYRDGIYSVCSHV